MNWWLILSVALAINDAQAYGEEVGELSRGGQLEKGNQAVRLLTRLVNNRDHFEIPSLPLEEQSDPDKITHIDADLRACTGPIRNQRTCGACYAFSWLSYVEWHYCAQTGGKKIDLSEQHLVDCGHRGNNMRQGGCNAGHLPLAMDFSAIFGFHYEADYPYQARKRSCRSEMGKLKAKFNAKRIPFDRQVWKLVLKEQPILVQVNLPHDIDSYLRGIHPNGNCDKHRAHGMLLVGHGRQEGKPYWLLRNSQGPNWGENGYLRLASDSTSECIQTGFIAQLKFKDLDEDNYDKFYQSIKYQPELVPVIDEAVVRSNLL